ncbi:MAG: DUF2779 domain-containing protein [Smithellaceae bacterium]
MQKISTYLSKSLFIRGLQCHKSLYLQKFRPELKDAITDEKEKLFSGGNEVGILAHDLFPGGSEVPYEGLSYQEQLELTQSIINQGYHTIYEAAFQYAGVFIKADILHLGKDGWEVYEVKASTAVKDYQIHDASIQYHVLFGINLPVSKTYLVHINNQYVRNGDIEVDKLFSKVDVTETVINKQAFIVAELEKQWNMLNGDEPAIGIGPHCDDPYECDFKGHCWSDLPKDSIFDIRGRLNDKYSLYKQGVTSMYDVSPEYLSAAQSMQIAANRNRQSYYDLDAVRGFINDFWYPIYFLDFETFMTAIPPFDGIRPYQQIPFQYSLHYIEHEGGDLKHHEFLARPNTDPREELINKLLIEIPDNACVVAYNKSFEIGVLKNLTDRFPEHKKQIDIIIKNMRDLMDPFRRKDIYHWQQNGSYSLKEVLPAMLPEFSYDNLDVQDGGMAMQSYAKMNQINDPNEIESIRKALLEYCCLDTLAMVKIFEKLKSNDFKESS